LSLQSDGSREGPKYTVKAKGIQQAQAFALIHSEPAPAGIVQQADTAHGTWAVHRAYALPKKNIP